MTNAKFIRGVAESRQVYFDAENLSPAKSKAWANHSPDGFNWGYTGSGPSQLALAILMEFTDEDTALKHYQTFKFEVVAGFEQGKNFEIPTSKVIEWLISKKVKLDD